MLKALGFNCLTVQCFQRFKPLVSNTNLHQYIEVEGRNNVGKLEVVAQGNAVEKVARLLSEVYGVPPRLVDAKDKLKGKGKNK